MDESKKRKININALQKISPLIDNYIDAFRLCTVYSFNQEKNEWEKNQVNGPLFLCTIQTQKYLTLIILNETPYIDPKDYILNIKPSFKILLKENQVYFHKDDGKDICVSCNSEKEAEKLYEDIKKYAKYKENENLMREIPDVTFKHALYASYYYRIDE